MSNLDDNFYAQYKEIKKYWRKRRHNRAIIYCILAIIIGITMTVLQNNEYYVLIKYPLIIALIGTATCALRELIIPMREENREIARLKDSYNHEKLREDK